MKVVVVDDDSVIRKIAVTALSRSENLIIESAGSGQEAMSVFETVLPDVVLMDVEMPDMSGPELLRRMQQSPRLAGIPVIFLTAHSATRQLQYAGLEGVIGLISKPFKSSALADDVRKLYMRHMGASLPSALRTASLPSQF
jgi:two-component system OmpR family response regulator